MARQRDEIAGALCVWSIKKRTSVRGVVSANLEIISGPAGAAEVKNRRDSTRREIKWFRGD